jgi:hypothetical protein
LVAFDFVLEKDICYVRKGENKPKDVLEREILGDF